MSESDLARRCRSTDVLPNPETPRRLVLQALDIVPSTTRMASRSSLSPAALLVRRPYVSIPTILPRKYVLLYYTAVYICFASIFASNDSLLASCSLSSNRLSCSCACRRFCLYRFIPRQQTVKLHFEDASSFEVNGWYEVICNYQDGNLRELTSFKLPGENFGTPLFFRAYIYFNCHMSNLNFVELLFACYVT